MQSNSTAPIPADKPAKVSNGRQSDTTKPSKPYPDFPLFPHATKRWAKKIRGQIVYFGPWTDPDGALAKYLENKDDLHAGRTPKTATDALTVNDLANRFLAAKRDRVDSGELSGHTWRDYKVTTDLLVSKFGKRRLLSDIGPDDFTKLRNVMSKKWGLHRVAKHIQFVRSVFKFAFESEMIETHTRFGPAFARPSKKSFRLDKAKREVNLFTTEEIHTLLEAATVPMRAMLLLAINCGLGNSDVGLMPNRALDLEGGWLNYPRPKTGVGRRCPLWPETVEALHKWFAQRPAPKDDANADLVFVTKYGGSWGKPTSDNPVSKEMSKLIKAAGINAGRTFYTLRHTHRTIADQSCNQRACDVLMGHDDGSMGSRYVERVSDERLLKVASVVHVWLFATKEPDGK